ncbi:MAG: flagellar export protein FliJ [Deltaproteobacteria bacterium RIFOXYD12_FULL_57_12]|nr:MAG: flagellar export protein FliJ [Deltaproteobacteria bacterium RIFOXYD12_FULL_57_12]
MKPFKLQSVLDYRQLQKNKAQQQLSEALRKEASLLLQLDREQHELKNLHEELRKIKAIGVTVHELELYENRCDHKMECLTLLASQLEKQQREIMARRQALSLAAQEEKMMEKLKERQIAEERQLLQRRERTEADEIAIRFHGR